MAWNGTGTYSRPVTTVSPAVADTTIDPDAQNTLTADITDGINSCLAKNGENAATSNLDLGGHKIENMVNGTADTDSAAFGQITKPTYVSNSNGNPNISDTPLDVSGSFTASAWESVGPTGAGADNTWTVLDALDSDIDWIEVRVWMRVSGAAETIVAANLYARAGGGAQAVGIDNLVAGIMQKDGNADSKQSQLVTTAKIPMGTGKIFDALYSETGTVTELDLHLVGYGWNP